MFNLFSLSITFEKGKEIIEKRITLYELQSALKKIKIKKYPVPDEITNETLKQIGNVCTINFLIFSTTNGPLKFSHKIWKESIMIPIYHKKRKALRDKVYS